MQKLGAHLATAVGAYDNARREFIKIDKDVIKIGGENRESIEIQPVDKPGSV